MTTQGKAAQDEAAELFHTIGDGRFIVTTSRGMPVVPSVISYTTKEAADILGISERTLVEWRQHGDGPAVTYTGKQKGLARYLPEDLAAFLRENRREKSNHARDTSKARREAKKAAAAKAKAAARA